MDYKTLTMKLRVHFAMLPIRLDERKKDPLIPIFKNVWISYSTLILIFTESKSSSYTVKDNFADNFEDGFETDSVSFTIIF